MSKLAGQVVVVTGASQGVGRAIARALGAEQARVALIARGIEGLEAAAQEIRVAGGEALVLPLDVGDARAVDAASDAVVARWGHIDVWINDAMLSVFSPVSEMKAEEYRRVTEVTYLGYVHGTLSALKHMRPRKAGMIVQIGSALAYRSVPLQSAYCGAKAAMRGFTDSLHSELLNEKSRIRLMTLQLPAVNTPHFDVARSRLPRHPRPMGPVFAPEVIAKAVLYAIEHPARELWVGGPTVKIIVAQRLFPALIDRYLALVGYTGQQTSALPRSQNDNLEAPLPGDRGAHGAFSREARSESLELWLRMHRKSVAIGSMAAVVAILWARS